MTNSTMRQERPEKDDCTHTSIVVLVVLVCFASGRPMLPRMALAIDFGLISSSVNETPNDSLGIIYLETGCVRPGSKIRMTR